MGRPVNEALTAHTLPAIPNTNVAPDGTPLIAAWSADVSSVVPSQCAFHGELRTSYWNGRVVPPTVTPVKVAVFGVALPIAGGDASVARVAQSEPTPVTAPPLFTCMHWTDPVRDPKIGVIMNVCGRDQVFAVLSSGTVAPLVPLLSSAAVPKEGHVPGAPVMGD